MRTITSPQRTQVGSAALAIFSKIEIQDPDLAWRDVSTSLSTPDWFNEATLTESIDQVSQSFTAVLLRDTGSLSLAPLRTDSTINRNGVGSYAPMLDVRRMWRVSVAVVAQGSTPSSGDWKEIGKGYIDTIDVQGSPSTIAVTGRDMLAQLLDAYMHGVDGVLPFPPYSPSGTDSMETVIQQILDDTLGTGRANVGSSGITLYTPLSPGYVMKQYQIGTGPLMNTLTKVAQLAGMVLRYRYDSSDALRLTLLKPPRTATVADWTIGPNEYSVIPVNKLDITGVRTLIDLFYIDSTLGKQHVTSPVALTGTLSATAGAATFSVSQAGVIANGSVILVAGNMCVVSAFNGTTGCTLSGSPTFAASPWTTSAAITKYGVRYMKVDLSGSLPMTAANAQAMVDAIRSDLETPWLEQRLTSYALWFAQLYDYAKALANGVQYNTDQLGGVTSITHRLKGGTVKTDVGLRGQPAGGYRLWTATGLTPPDAAALTVTATPGNPNYSIAWSGSGVLLSIDGATAAPPSASPITVPRNAPGGADKVYTFTGTSNGTTVSNTVTIPAQSGSTAPSLQLVPSLINNQIDDTTSPVTLTASATNLPASYSWAIRRGYSKGQYNSTPVWSGSNALNPLTQTESVNPNAKLSFWYQLDVVVGSDHYYSECQVQGLMAFVNPSGAPVRGTAWSDGGYSTVALDANGYNLHSNVGDASGLAARRANLFYAKGLSGNPDTGDSIVDGASYGITSFNQRTGGGRGFAALDSGNVLVAGSADLSRAYANKNGQYIARSGSDATAIATIVGSIDNSGNAASTMLDSGARPINKFFAKGLSGNPDQLDSVPDGASYARPYATRINAGRPWIDFSETIHSNKTADNIGDGANYRVIGLTESHQNLAPAQLASSTLYPNNVNFQPTLAQLGLSVGDIISFSGLITNNNGSDTQSAYFYVQYYNGATLIGSNATSFPGPTVTAETYCKVEYIAVPVGCDSMVIGFYTGRPGGAKARRLMLNRGPRAIPFTDAPLRLNRDTADNLSDGATYGITTKTDRTNLVATVDASGIIAGKVLRARALDDGKYAVVSSIAAGTYIDSSVSVSTGAAANKMFAKGLSSSPDTADSISNGSTNRVTTLNEATGGGRGYSALDVNNRIADQSHIPMVRVSSGGATPFYGGGNTTNCISTVTYSGGVYTANIPAWVLYAGSFTKSYNSGSVGGLGQNLTYYIYCDDPNYAGGAVTYYASTTIYSPTNNDGRVYVGAVTTGSGGSASTTYAGGAAACFEGDTLISMADGSEKRIAEITEGDVVVSFDPATGELGHKRVTGTMVHQIPESLTIESEQGRVVTTAEHPFYLEGGTFGAAGWLRHGNYLMRLSQRAALHAERVLSVHPDARATTVYNFEVEDWHTYIANGFAVHNVKLI